MRGSVASLAALSLALAACPPPPDPDALPAAAIPLTFGRTHVDALDCRRNDCTDWFRIRVPGKGNLDIDLRPAENAAEATTVNLTVLDPSGRQLAQGKVERTGSGRSELRLVTPVEAGNYLFAVAAQGTRKRIDYRVSAAFQSAPAPRPQPTQRQRFRIVSTRVLEVEGRSSVLLEAGVRDGIRSGQSGKLLGDERREIGEITVTEVYNDGSRARIEGALGGVINARTKAEIRVPE